MTANTTPRLGLMLPVGSDTFTPDDFISTFTKLDGVPGITPVSSYAALPTGLTEKQHGSVYMQTDNLAQWMWNKPTSTSTGVWQRINSVGFLGSAPAMTKSYTNSTTSETGAPTIQTVTVKAPGGRRLGVYARISSMSHSASGVTEIFIVYNGTTVVVRGYGSSGNTTGNSQELYYITGVASVGQSLQFDFRFRPYNAGTSTANNGGSALYVWEI
jgi:hypothetical protein